MSNKNLNIIQINEVNFDLVKKYSEKYDLPNLKKLISNFKFIETSSEEKYENLEPWIQWVSFYTGKSAADHKVKHLNEASQDTRTFFNEIENKNKLSFMFPMNLKNNFKVDTFFIPDPWTTTQKNIKSKLLSKFYEISKILILQNQRMLLNFQNIIIILLVFLKYTSIKGKFFLTKYAFLSIFKKYYRAIFFDFFIAEIFFKNTKEQKTNINTVFFNAAAHIQHHYLLSSEFYKKKYLDLDFIRKDDPLLECYKAYDVIVGNYLDNKNFNFFFATGLSQVAIEKPIYYWNLKNHESFFANIGIESTQIEKRMSRDYTLYFDNEQKLTKSFELLNGVKLNNKKIFSLEKKQNRIYLELIYNLNIVAEEKLYDIDDKIISSDFLKDLNFVAVKNSIHFQKGYVFTDLDINLKKTNIKDFYSYFVKNYG